MSLPVGAFLQVEVLPGLDYLVHDELVQGLKCTTLLVSSRPGTVVTVDEYVDLDSAERARIAGSLAVCRTFAVPRPTALLGHRTLQAIAELLNFVVRRRAGAFRALRLAAAGAQSP